MVNYRSFFEASFATVRDEGRYREFQDIRRTCGEFPKATWYKTQTGGSVSEHAIIVWCSNDYLGQGQNPCVREAVKQAVDRAGNIGSVWVQGDDVDAEGEAIGSSFELPQLFPIETGEEEESGFFADGFESGDTSAWSTTVP